MKDRDPDIRRESYRPQRVNPHSFRTSDGVDGILAEEFSHIIPDDLRRKIQRYQLAKERILRYINRKAPTPRNGLPADFTVRLLIKYGLKGALR